MLIVIVCLLVLILMGIVAPEWTRSSLVSVILFLLIATIFWGIWQ